MTAIITNYHRKQEMQLLADDITANNGSNYFVFLSRHQPWTSEINPETEDLSVYDSQLNTKRQMLGGKLITNADVTFLIDRNNWVANSLYDAYDHRVDMSDKQYFVINSSNNVYKCIWNADGLPSTVEPTSTPNTVFQLADGYVWKYMFGLSSANATKFAYDNFIPFDEDTNVTGSAVDGAIHIVTIETGGTNWVTAEGFVQQVLSSTVYRVDGDSTIGTNGYYTDSALYIANGTSVGSLAKISNYYSNTSGKYVVLDTALSLGLDSGFLISPYITITGDGANAVAYCTVDGGVIDDVIMIDEGSGYSTATVTASANSSHGSGEALTAIISPRGGHGSNVPVELNCRNLGLSVSISNNESGSFVTELSFRQTGIIHNPLPVGNSTPWSNSVFNNTLSFDVTTVSGFDQAETVTGLTSGARALVGFSNSSHVIMTGISGTFANGETIFGAQSSVSGVISNINISDIDPQTGDVLYFQNFQSINRSDTTSEIVRLNLQF